MRTHTPPIATLVVLLLPALLLAACSVTPLPDLKRLYQTSPLPYQVVSAVGEPPPPVILIHGAFGARLRHKGTGREVWPGGPGTLLFNDSDKVALPIDPDTLLPAPSELEVHAITDRVAGRDYYGAIISSWKWPEVMSTGRPANRSATSSSAIASFTTTGARITCRQCGNSMS